MATQRITLIKVGGCSADYIEQKLQSWVAARTADKIDDWSPEQLPLDIRQQADDLADRLIANSSLPPVIHFVSWIDQWSMGDLVPGWLTSPDGSPLLFLQTDRYEIYGYPLPDEKQLIRSLKRVGDQQWDEIDCYRRRLKEAVVAWQKIIDRSIIVVLREVLGATVLDEEVVESLSQLPEWLS